MSSQREQVAGPLLLVVPGHAGGALAEPHPEEERRR